MNIDLPLITIRTKDHLIDLLLIKGKWPHFGGPYCQNLMNRAMDIYIKSHDPKEVTIVRGGRMEERGKRQNPPKPNRWLTIRRNSDYKYFQPMYFASKDVGQAILEKLEMPIWEGYSFGLQRTACRVCPGQRPIGYAAIRANFPYIWEELLNLESILGPGCWNDPLKNKSQGSFTYLADHGQRAFELSNYRKTTSNMINFDTVTF